MHYSLSSLLINGNSLTLCLLGLQLSGDRVQRSEELPYALKAVVDSGVHGLAAGISWLIVIVSHQGGYFYTTAPFHGYGAIYEVLACAFLGSVIDVDHFIAARSFHLKDALHLRRRPMFHSTTFLSIVVLFLALLSIVGSSSHLWKWSLIVLVAGLTHHLRDGFRRGLWFPPFGSTPPVPYPLYLLSTIILPQIVQLFLIQPRINVDATIPFSV